MALFGLSGILAALPGGNRGDLPDASPFRAGQRVRMKGDNWTGMGSPTGTVESPGRYRVLVQFDDGTLVDVDVRAIVADGSARGDDPANRSRAAYVAKHGLNGLADASLASAFYTKLSRAEKDTATLVTRTIMMGGIAMMTPHGLKTRLGVTQKQAELLLTVRTYAFGSGGRGYDWARGKVAEILAGRYPRLTPGR